MELKQISSVLRAYSEISHKIDIHAEEERQRKINMVKNKRGDFVGKEVKQKKESSDEKESITSLDQHKVGWEVLFKRYELDSNVFETGLTSDQADKKNKEEGDNVLTTKDKNPWWVLLLHEWSAPFALMLWAGSALCFIAYGLDPSDPSNLYLGIVLAFVISLSGIITFLQNAKSDSVMEGFKNFIPLKCKVLRDGKVDEVPASKLVTGDIIVVKNGEKIPADIRIIECKEMRVDNSSLTGESDPLLRKPECDNPEKILETKNVAFFGSKCVAGGGKGMVFNIGDKTIIGQIANLTESADAGQTPLRKELDRFIALITIIAVSLGLMFFCLGFVLKYGIVANLVFAIGIIVANVPEGLLATITITLSVTSIRMQAKKVLVKNLESVETLGSTSCICSDKTGTLTQNKMTIENLFFDGKIVKGANRETFGKDFPYQYDINSRGFKELHECAIIGSEATFSNALPDRLQAAVNNLNKDAADFKEKKKAIEDEWKVTLSKMPYMDRPVNGDASETGIVKFFQPIQDVEETRARFEIGVQKDGAMSLVPFGSEHKFALKVVRSKTEDSEWCVYLKGAPERVWDKCSKVLVGGRDLGLDKGQFSKIEEANTYFAKNGQRVLGLARYHLPKRQYPENHKFEFKGFSELDIRLDDMTFIGLLSLIDPPRETVPGAIKKCKTAGIKVIMVTGDQQLTAASIAKQIGIFESESSVEIQERLKCSYEEALERAQAIVINGTMLTQAELDDEGLPEDRKGKKLEKWLLKPQIVFARTSPAQKLYIVKGCQKLGYTVAVTGDGVNDSPAIKQADIGIAMGITGSDVAKDSADMVLLNDDFSSIIMGIEEGRKIFDNLKKSIAYTLTSNIPELIPFLTFIILQIPLPLSTVLILCIDLGTDIVPAVSFAYEYAELDIMTRKPRKQTEHLVTAKLMVFSYCQMGIIQTFGGYLAYCLIMYDFGFNAYDLFYVVLKQYYPHNPTDVYDPTHKFLGNTNVKIVDNELRLIDANKAGTLSDSSIADGGRLVDWLFTNHIDQDLRLGYLKVENGQATGSLNFVGCQLRQVSPISRRPVCYSTESLKYAQTGFFFGIVITQCFNELACKTRLISLANHGLRNTFTFFGWSTEFLLCIILCYCVPIMHVLGTRDLVLRHFFIPAIPMGFLMLIWDESRKYLARNLPGTLKHPNWFARNTIW